jgi:hypothetical protein
LITFYGRYNAYMNAVKTDMLSFFGQGFKLVHDIDDTRQARYGVYYTRKNPLALSKIPGI